jgi:hypothetical protein
MTESEFISNIDCCFPYGKPIQWRRLSAVAPRISSNAAFMVLHEICRPPRSEKVTGQSKARMVAHLKRRFRHSALRAIQPAVCAYLADKRLRPGQAVHLMRKLGKHREEFNALGICYFSAYDKAGTIERCHDQVTSAWERSE